MPIRVLPESVASRIAAGEVVERPASVLKELLENALDAGARRVEIEADAAGKKRLRVRDNGRGMTPEDAKLAIQRHATSKLSSIEDLESLATYGFRGEALYAIAAVSRFTLSSGHGEGPALRAWTIEAEGGTVVASHDAPPVPGTSVEIRDLFFNTPARLRFLKSDATEKARLTRVVEDAALAHPELAFVYALDGRESLRLPAITEPGLSGMRARVQELMGFDFLASTAEVAAERGGARLMGVASKPDRLAASRQAQYFFVNRRPVQNRTLQQALYRAYESRHGRHPACVIFLELPPTDVDVNVHPQKLEVRFRNESAIFTLIDEALRKALAPHAAPPPLLPPVRDPGPGTSELREAIQSYRANPRPPEELVPAANGKEHPVETPAGNGTSHPESPAPAASESGRHADGHPRRAHENAPAWYAPPFRFLGQLERSYLVLESHGGLLLVDQHAAAERVVYERYLEEFVHGAPKAQRLMLPVTVDFPPSVAERVLALSDWLHAAGFEVDGLGKGTVAIHAAPAVFDLDAPSIKDLFGALADELDPKRLGEEARRETVAIWACKKAVKAHDRLGPDRGLRLLEDLKHCRDSLHCPHGRPALLRLTRDELARRFGRPGAPPL